MKLIDLTNAFIWTSAFLCLLTTCALLLRFLFFKYLYHTQIANLRGLEFFCEIYKLTALTDNVESILLTAPEKREEMQYHCQVRTACLDRLNALSMRHHQHTYSLLKLFNPFQSQTKLNFFKDDAKEVKEFIQTDALEILALWKQKTSREFADAKCKSSCFTAGKIDA